jgi:hypothetical protein
VKPALFPGGHTGFADQPDIFATRLRAVLGVNWPKHLKP